MTTTTMESEDEPPSTRRSSESDSDLDEQVRRLIGQMILVTFDEPTVTKEVRILIEKYYVGNFKISRRNIQDATQLAALTTELQKIAQAAGYQQPLLIAIDQENGMISKFGDGMRATHFPGSMAIGATRQANNAYEVAKAMGKELIAVGINWVFAPILDVVSDNNPTIGVRSFGDNPVEVSRFIRAFLDGINSVQGLTCTPGTFPMTAGKTVEKKQRKAESVMALKTDEQWEEQDFVPFRSAVASGLPGLRISSSIWTDDSSSSAEARHIVQDVLRRKVGHEGVVVCDCTEMPQFTQRSDIREAVVLAIGAGCDVLEIDQSVEVQVKGIESIYDAVRSGRLIRNDIYRSTEKIKMVKSQLSWSNVLSSTDATILPRLMAEHEPIAKRIYEASVTLARDQSGFLPLSLRLHPHEKVLLLTPVVRPLHPTPAGDVPVDPFECFGRALATRHSKVRHAPYNVHGLNQIHISLIRQASAVILVTCNALQCGTRTQIQTAKSVVRLCGNKPLVCVAACNPDDLLADHSFGTYLCTYEYTKLAMEAAAAVIFGEKAASGVLPVGIPGAPTRRQQRQWSVDIWEKRRDLFTSADLWKECLGSKWPMDPTTLSTLLDRPGYSKHFVVRNPVSGELLGLAVTYTIMGQKRSLGSLALLIVRPSHRNQGIGLSLHDVAMREISKTPNIASMQLGSIFPRIFPGLPVDLPVDDLNWFAHRGWRLQNNLIYDLFVEIDKTIEPVDVMASLANMGIEFSACRPEKFDSLMNFEQRNFNTYPGWVEKYADLRDSDDIADIILATVQGTIVGAALLFTAVGNNQISRDIPWPRLIGERNGGLACVSVKDSYRSHGLGIGLIWAAILELKQRGLTGCFVDWVDKGEFEGTYKRVGFQQWGQYREIWRKV